MSGMQLLTEASMSSPPPANFSPLSLRGVLRPTLAELMAILNGIFAVTPVPAPAPVVSSCSRSTPASFPAR